MGWKGRLEPYHWLLIGAGTASLAGSLASGFVSLFILVSGHQLVALVSFAAGQFAGIWLMGYVLAGLLSRFRPLGGFRWGLVLTAAFYALLIALGHRAAGLAGPLGFAYGLGQGVYWYSLNILIYDTVSASTRLAYYSATAAVAAAVGVAAPVLGGLIVSGGSQVPGGSSGYEWLFVIALVLYVATGLVSLFMHPGEALRRLPLGPAFHLHRVNPRWRLVALTQWVSGFRQGVLAVAPVTLVYLATHQALSFGVYGSLTAAAGLISARWLSRRLTRALWPRFLLIGVIGALAAVGVLTVSTAFLGVVVYGLLTAFFQPVMAIPTSNQALSVMDEDREIGRHRGLYILSRENGMNGGRILGLMAVLVATRVASASSQPAVPLILIMTVAVLLQFVLPWTAARLAGAEPGPRPRQDSSAPVPNSSARRG